MICTSIQGKTLEEILQVLESGTVEMAEIRLDLCDLEEEEIETLFSGSDVPLVATCRVSEVARRMQDGAGASDRDAAGASRQGMLSDAGRSMAEAGLLPSRLHRGRDEAEERAERQLLKAVEAGAKYVDLEVEAPPMMGRKIRQACREYGTVLIRSYHDFTGTPPAATLLSVLEKAQRFGGEVVKVVTTATGPEEVAAVQDLYREMDPGRLIAFCMGDAGRTSRLDALRFGAPFTYACLTPEEATAPGQWTTAEMRAAVYGGFHFIGTAGHRDKKMTGNPPEPSSGAGWVGGKLVFPTGHEETSGEVLQMPASKSFAQRAIVAAALAEGTSHLTGYSPCVDNESALAVARALGAEVRVEGAELTITGIDASERTLELDGLHTGESGFLTRMMIPLMAVLGQGPVRVTGEKTLLRRPLSGAHDIMASFGVRLLPEGQAAGRPGDCYVPLTVAGPLVPGRADVSGKGGSQLISGLLAALPLAGNRSTLYVHDPRSIPYLFITVDVLKKFGIRIGSEMEGGEDFLETQDWSLCTGVTFKVRGGQCYRAADFRIEGDWSGAANFLVAGAIFGEVEVEGLDSQSLQADISILDILMEAGASMSQFEGATPTTGPVHVSRAPLGAFDTDLNNCPDLFPIVAVLAAFCPGSSHILGVQRLAHKETDRAVAVVDMLTQLGVTASVAGDEMTVEGMSLAQRLLTGRLLKGGRYTSHGDHRMVMALKVASLGADGPVDIDDTACVAKSFPGFLDLFDRWAGLR